MLSVRLWKQTAVLLQESLLVLLVRGESRRTIGMEAVKKELVRLLLVVLSEGYMLEEYAAVRWLCWLRHHGGGGGVGGGVVVLSLRRVGITGKHRCFDMVFRSFFFNSLGRW